MSKYTTEVRYICETYADLAESGEFPDVQTIIDNSFDKVFDFEFPIFDENYRAVLEKKILLHYYTREIGLETVGLWKLKLMSRLNDIMPYYNQLYKSELLEFNPLVDVDLKTQHIGSSDNTSNGTSENKNSANSIDVNKGTSNDSGTNRNLFSDTPQGALTGVENESYLSSATKNITDNSRTARNESNSASASKNNSSFENKINTTDQYIEHITGKNGGENYAKKLMDFRKTFLNIDMQVINELKDLFMYLW